MLSKIDIQKELGKGISIYPLHLENIKENSINLSAGRYAWAMKSMTVYYNEKEKSKEKKFSLVKDTFFNKAHKIINYESAIFEDYIILLPNSTTLIETEEVLSLKDYIGGTYHSKVGIASHGIGHIGTMVGPNFSGDSLIALHNVSENLVILNIGDTIVSVVFYYLKTRYKKINPTVSGHTDKFSELGIVSTEDELKILNADWKKQFDSVNEKMISSKEYKKLKKELKDSEKKRFIRFFTKRKIILLFVILLLSVLISRIAVWCDNTYNTNVWTDRYWTIFIASIFACIINIVFGKIFKD